MKLRVASYELRAKAPHFTRNTQRATRNAFALYGLIAIILFQAPAIAQRIIIRGGNRPMIIGGFPPNVGEDATGGVYVRDSAIAMEKLALAQRMERLHEWAKSADVYQEILEKYQDRVVPTHTDQLTQVPDRYASVTETVRQSLCKWPVEG